MKHEPSRLLGNTKVGCKLVAGYALLVKGQKVDGNEPRLKADFGIAENGVGLHGEILLAASVRAHVLESGFALIGLLGAAMRADGISIRPTNRGKVGLTNFNRAKLLHELDHAVEFLLVLFNCFHCRVSFDIVNIEAAIDISRQGFATIFGLPQESFHD